ncbi:hypothetical protein F5887DRAFT_194540 [Amanita rubescens]|nr:hypothetical protein F5887DRAFT_194540 [Amanita rubescens]
MRLFTQLCSRRVLSTFQRSHAPSSLRLYPLSPTTRFFSSNHHHLQRWVRHPQTNGGPQKKGFLKFLDNVSPNAIFTGILAINGVVFVMWYMSGQRLQHQRDPSALKWMFQNFACSWAHVKAGRVWTLVTNCFSHKDAAHILFNGLTFYFMAKPVLHMLGSRHFVILYLGSGIVSNLISIGFSNIIEGRDNPSIGASACNYSVISFLACVAPKMTFQFYGIIPVPAWLAVSGIFAYDTYSTVSKNRTETNTVGHVAGLLCGIGYFLFRRNRMFL